MGSLTHLSHYLGWLEADGLATMPAAIEGYNW
jgi:hypothetical protein